ncbi:MAG: peptidoglycan DD-metalloendopeptidase family protein [Nitrincola lacisaponensis]|uniref:peptidoglycan DD-metalloendopeptidase family protein n=1 Tax=Nitrincola lacisaponensis TaxID=267850 RepID=UPI00391B5CD7
MRRGRIAYIVGILSLGLFQGCSTGYAPVTDRSMGARQIGVPVTAPATASRPAPLPNPGSYTVNRGDTLYSISWRYGLDYREVARWNNLNERFQIFPGQVLRLSPGGSSAVAAAPVAATPAPASSSQRTTAPAAQTSSQPASSSTAQQSAARPVASSPSPATSSGALVWRWPAEGPIIRRFSSQEGGNKGIDIAGQQGDPVRAAADGRVVYAGSGLLGYGNLVIVNHNREFLSAYAHNSRILVSENDMVKAGDKIAEMGQTGTDRVQLHFEIRRDGRPVDPLSYLPRR